MTGVVIDEGVTGIPDACLASAVGRYQGYRQRGVTPQLHRGLPSPWITLIFTLDEPLLIERHVDPRRAAGEFETLAGGLHAVPVLLRHDGAQSGIQVLVNPLASRAMFGVPAAELAGQDDQATAILGREAERIQDRLRSVDTWEKRFGVLDAALGEIVHRNDRQRPADAVVGAWTRLRASGGRIGIATLASDMGFGERHLNGLMRRELGMSPKTAAKVIRFDGARRALQRTGGRIADVASRFGYFD